MESAAEMELLEEAKTWVRHLTRLLRRLPNNQIDTGSVMWARHLPSDYARMKLAELGPSAIELIQSYAAYSLMRSQLGDAIFYLIAAEEARRKQKLRNF